MSATVSVIIPTHRRPEMAMNAVRSVLAQSHSPVEILLIVDGEEIDPYEAVEERLATPLLRVLRPGVHLGLTAVKNLGVEQATGRIVAFLDDDDFWYPTKLEDQLAQVEHVGLLHDDFVSATAFHAASIHGVARWPGRDPVDDEPVSEFLLNSKDRSRHQVLQASTYMSSRHLASRVPFRGRAFEDWDWLIRTSSEAPFVWSPNPGGQFRIGNPTTMTSGTSIDDAIAWYESIEPWLTPRAKSGFHATVMPRLMGRRREFGALGASVRTFASNEPGWREALEFAPRLISAWRGG